MKLSGFERGKSGVKVSLNVIESARLFSTRVKAEYFFWYLSWSASSVVKPHPHF